jgi:hypothetical protein
MPQKTARFVQALPVAALMGAIWMAPSAAQAQGANPAGQRPPPERRWSMGDHFPDYWSKRRWVPDWPMRDLPLAPVGWSWFAANDQYVLVQLATGWVREVVPQPPRPAQPPQAQDPGQPGAAPLAAPPLAAPPPQNL